MYCAVARKGGEHEIKISRTVMQTSTVSDGVDVSRLDAEQISEKSYFALPTTLGMTYASLQDKELTIG